MPLGVHRHARSLAAGPDSGQAVPVGLTHLNVGGNGLGPRGAAALAQRWEPLSRIEHLDVSVTRIGDEGLASLAESPYVSRLSSLACGGAMTGVTDRGVSSVLRSAELCGLRELDLSNIRMGPRFGELLAESDLAAGLTRLTVRGCGIGQGDLLAMLPSLRSLRELCLAHNSIGEACIEPIFEACPRLERLDLSFNSLEEEGVRALFGCSHASKLRALCVTFYGNVHGHPARAEFAELAAQRGVALVLG